MPDSRKYPRAIVYYHTGKAFGFGQETADTVELMATYRDEYSKKKPGRETRKLEAMAQEIVSAVESTKIGYGASKKYEAEYSTRGFEGRTLVKITIKPSMPLDQLEQIVDDVLLGNLVELDQKKSQYAALDAKDALNARGITGGEQAHADDKTPGHAPKRPSSDVQIT